MEQKQPQKPAKETVSPKSVEAQPAPKVSPVPAPAPVPSKSAPKTSPSFKNDTKPGSLDQAVELPSSYGDHKLVALVRDPWWIYAYWELSPDKVKAAVEAAGGGSLKGMLRLHDVTDLQFTGANAHSFRDQEIQFESGSAYLSAWESNRSYLVELGLSDSKGAFKPLLRSTELTVPRADPSSDRGEDWVRFSEAMDRIYRLSGGLGDAGRSTEDQLRLHFLSSQTLQNRTAKP